MSIVSEQGAGRVAVVLALVSVGLILPADWAQARSRGENLTARYASIAREDCGPLSSALQKLYESMDLSAAKCGGLGKWQLITVSSDARSWIDLARDDRVWTLEPEVVYQTDFGNFPNLGARRAEWRIDASGQPHALIFRIAAQDSERLGEASARTSRLYVLRIDGGEPRFCGYYSTNEEARLAADSATGCGATLQRRVPSSRGS